MLLSQNPKNFKMSQIWVRDQFYNNPCNCSRVVMFTQGSPVLIIASYYQNVITLLRFCRINNCDNSCIFNYRRAAVVCWLYSELVYDEKIEQDFFDVFLISLGRTFANKVNPIRIANQILSSGNPGPSSQNRVKNFQETTYLRPSFSTRNRNKSTWFKSSLGLSTQDWSPFR